MRTIHRREVDRGQALFKTGGWGAALVLLLSGCENFQQLGVGVCQRASPPGWCVDAAKGDGGSPQPGEDGGASDGGSVSPRVKWVKRWGGQGKDVPSALAVHNDRVALVGWFDHNLSIEGRDHYSNDRDPIWVSWTSVDGGPVILQSGARNEAGPQTATDLLHRPGELLVALRDASGGTGGGIYLQPLDGGTGGMLLPTVGEVTPAALAELENGEFAVVGYARGQASFKGQSLGASTQDVAFLFQTPSSALKTYGCAQGAVQATDLVTYPSGRIDLVGGLPDSAASACQHSFMNSQAPSLFFLRQEPTGVVPFGAAASNLNVRKGRLARNASWLWWAQGHQVTRLGPDSQTQESFATFDPQNLVIEDLALDSQDNVLIVGHTLASTVVEGQPLPWFGKRDIFVARYRQDGTHLWSRTFGGAEDDVGVAVVATASEIVVAASCASASIEMDAFTMNAEPSMQDLDICLFALEH